VGTGGGGGVGVQVEGQGERRGVVKGKQVTCMKHNAFLLRSIGRCTTVQYAVKIMYT
jgi:hypothetical protein